MKIALAAVLVLAVAAPVAADDCRHTAPRQLSAATDGVKVVEIRARAGALVVRGGASSGVRATGTACASSADLLEGIRLVSSRSGDRLIVEAEVAESSTWSLGWSVQRRLDFEVELPRTMAVKIADGSGSIEVRDVGSVDIADGSGEIDVRGVAGVVQIEDGSGELSVRDAGEVRVTDGSGAIGIASVRGNVVIEEDGSGEIEIADVNGNVTIEDDGSGSIEIRNVGGDLKVKNDGSGGVSVTGVRGKVSIPK